MFFSNYYNFIIFLILTPLVVTLLQYKIANLKLKERFILLVSTLYGFLVIQNIIFQRWSNATIHLFDLAPEFSIKLALDGLSLVFIFVVALLWPAATSYSIGYMNLAKEQKLTRFYSFFCLAITATIGVALSANLLTLYLFYELLTFSTYPLVSHHQDEASKSSGRRYLTYILGPSILLALPALLYLYSVAGTLDFSGLSSFQVGGFVLLMLIFGFSKAALFPLHSWLPGAMVAPTPVSALLHAVAVVKVGVFSIVRVVADVYGTEQFSMASLLGVNLQQLLIIIAVVSIIWPSLVALSEDNLKRRLAFSTIGQLGYISLAAFIATSLSLQAGAMHIVMHAFAKITLFFAAGAIYLQTKKKYVSQLEGLAYQMPYTFAAIFIAAAGVVGLPLTGGFISKWNLIMATISADQIWLCYVFLLSSLLSSIYLFEIVWVGLRKSKQQDATENEINEVSNYCLLPICYTAGLTVLMFFSADIINIFTTSWVK